MDTTIVVGIDVSKDRLDVHVRPSGEAFVFGRDAAGVEALVAGLKPRSPRLVAVEATGGFETVVAASLAAASLPVVVVNPAQVRAFAKALGQRAKTDPIDAGVIAHSLSSTQSSGTEPHGKALDFKHSRSSVRFADTLSLWERVTPRAGCPCRFRKLEPRGLSMTFLAATGRTEREG
jgi:Transposase